MDRKPSPRGESQEGYHRVVRIGEVAAASNVSVKTIRYYEHVGVLTPATREPNGYRSYDPAVLDRLAFVRSAQSVGLTLGEIRETLAFRDEGEPPCAHVLNLIEQHAADLTDRIRDLKRTRRVLIRRSQRRAGGVAVDGYGSHLGVPRLQRRPAACSSAAGRARRSRRRGSGGRIRRPCA